MKNLTAVIMAAGRGARLLPLTLTIPKPLIKVLGKTSLEYTLDNIVGRASEVVIVVGYLKDKIINYFGKSHKGVRIKYVVQENFTGNAHALFLSQKAVTNKNILIINGDDLYRKSLISKISSVQNSVVVGKREKSWQNYGVIKNKDGKFLEEIVEKPKKFVGDLVNIGLYKVDKDIFSYFSKIKKSARGEYEITDMMTLYAKDHQVEIVNCSNGWTPLSYPWDLLNYAESALKDIKTSTEGVIEKGAVIKGNIYLSKNSRIKSGAYLEGNFYIGNNCEIGPNCYLKGFGSFDDGVVIGNAVEITRSIIGSNTKIKHLSYVGDSIVGNNVNVGAGTIMSNLRHDGANILVNVNGKLVDTGRKKFGAIVGDAVKTGIHTTLYPGTKLDAGTITKPGEVIKYEVANKNKSGN